MGICYSNRVYIHQYIKPENRTEDITQLFKVKKLIGRGGYSEVYECVNRKSNQTVALKRQLRVTSDFSSIKTEIDILQAIKHPNVMEYFDAYVDTDAIYIATKLYGGGELFDTILAQDRTSEKDASMIAKQMLDAIEYCHSKNIVHCDVKPENFLFVNTSRNSRIVLIDFGSANQVDVHQKYKQKEGTPIYLPPEFLTERTGYVLKAGDCWATGIVVYTLLTGRLPFDIYGRSLAALFNDILTQKITFPRDVELSNTAIHFVKSLLNKNPLKRFSAKKALRHEFISGACALSETSVFKEQKNKPLKKLHAHFQVEKKVRRMLNLLGCQRRTTHLEGIKRAFVKNNKRNITQTDNWAIDLDIEVSVMDKIIYKCFKMIDKEESNHISMKKLIHFFRFNEVEAKFVSEEMYQQDDGTINYIQFHNFLEATINEGNCKQATMSLSLKIQREDLGLFKKAKSFTCSKIRESREVSLFSGVERNSFEDRFKSIL